MAILPTRITPIHIDEPLGGLVFRKGDKVVHPRHGGRVPGEVEPGLGDLLQQGVGPLGTHAVSRTRLVWSPREASDEFQTTPRSNTGAGRGRRIVRSPEEGGS